MWSLNGTYSTKKRVFSSMCMSPPFVLNRGKLVNCQPLWSFCAEIHRRDFCQVMKWASSWDYGTFRPPQTHSSNAHAQPPSGARCLIFGRTLRLLPYFMWTNSEGSGETARMRRLAWSIAGRLCDKYHTLMSWLKWVNGLPYHSRKFNFDLMFGWPEQPYDPLGEKNNKDG